MVVDTRALVSPCLISQSVATQVTAPLFFSVLRPGQGDDTLFVCGYIFLSDSQTAWCGRHGKSITREINVAGVWRQILGSAVS